MQICKNHQNWIDPEQLFQAKYSISWYFNHFREILTFPRKRFFRGNPVSERNSHFFGTKRTFPVPGLQKTSQELTFIKVSEPGSQKTDSGPKRHLWAPGMLKKEKFRTFMVKWAGTLKRHREPWKTTNKRQGLPLFRESAKWWFSEIPNLLHKNQNSHRKRKRFYAVFATFRVFWSRAARMRQAL